jgi:hypothetical protein
MSSQTKLKSNVVPKVFKGETYFAELGVAKFEWTIKDFNGFVDLGKTIRSPSFNMDTTDPQTKVRSFHLEMEIPNKKPGSHCPVFLVNETGGEILIKISLESFSPKYSAYSPYVDLKLDATVVVQTSEEDKKKVMTATLPSNPIYLPKEVTIKVQVALSQPAEKIVS